MKVLRLKLGRKANPNWSSQRRDETGKWTTGGATATLDDVPSLKAKGYGFHRGDGGVAYDTTRNRMTLGRGTGHYGTGVYFNGDPPYATKYSRGDRPLLALDLTGKNLFVAKHDSNANNLHKGLRKLNDMSRREGGLRGEQLLATGRDYASDLHTAAFDLWISVGIRHNMEPEDVEKELIVTLDKYDSDPNNQDTASTIFMKMFGYDGVDVRGTQSDDTERGCVVYDPVPTIRVLGPDGKSADWDETRVRRDLRGRFSTQTGDANRDPGESYFDELPEEGKIDSFAPAIAEAAQKQYDEWDASGEFGDAEVGDGGICHLIAEDIAGILSDAGYDAQTVSSTWEQHVYVVARDQGGVYSVDIPYNVYETGGGFTWKKIEGVTFTKDDVVISGLSSDPSEMGDYSDEGFEEWRKKSANWHESRVNLSIGEKAKRDVSRQVRDAMGRWTDGIEVINGDDVSSIYGGETRQVGIFHRPSGAKLTVIVRADEPASIFELVVPEERRQQGIGTALQRVAQERFPNLQGQVSSPYALRSAYKLGRRPPGKPNATLEECEAMRQENSSVNMVSPSFNPNKGQPKPKKNPYWYRQPRREDGKWGEGGVVKPVRKPKGNLSPLPMEYGMLAPQSDYMVTLGEEERVKTLIGMNARDLHRMIENAYGPDERYNHEDCTFKAFAYTDAENTILSVGYSDEHATTLNDTTRLSLKMKFPKSGKAPTLEVSLVTMPSTIQKGGAGKRILGRLLDLADHIGADKIALNANIDIGAYAWARYGFLPDKQSWDNLRVKIRKSMVGIEGYPKLPNSEITKLSGTIKTLTAPNAPTENIRAIAALGVDCYHRSHKEGILGVTLLRGNHWNSTADLNDPVTLDHLQAAANGLESWTEEDAQRITGITPEEWNEKSARADEGVFFSNANGRRVDAHIHAELLPAGARVADAAAINILMRTGLSRADARRFVSISRGYGG